MPITILISELPITRRALLKEIPDDPDGFRYIAFDFQMSSLTSFFGDESTGKSEQIHKSFHSPLFFYVLLLESEAEDQVSANFASRAMRVESVHILTEKALRGRILFAKIDNKLKTFFLRFTFCKYKIIKIVKCILYIFRPRTNKFFTSIYLKIYASKQLN